MGTVHSGHDRESHVAAVGHAARAVWRVGMDITRRWMVVLATAGIAATGCTSATALERAPESLEGAGDGGQEDAEEEGSAETCTDVLARSHDECLIENGLHPGAGFDFEDPESAEIDYLCWNVAFAARDECCEASPDATCEDSLSPPPETWGPCADLQASTFSACAAEHGVDLDTDDSEGHAVLRRCWEGPAAAAFAECCATTFDEACEGWEPPVVEEPTTTCHDFLVATFEDCVRGLGIDPWSERHDDADALGHCWADVAVPAVEACRALAPDCACGVDPERRADPIDGATGR
jgi:hypothetical protein